MERRKAAIFRIRLITAIVLLAALVLMARLYQLQVIHFDEYVENGESQYVHTVRNLYDRGSIYFTTRDGEKVSAATIQSGYIMSVDPTRITDPETLYESLKPYLTIDKETFIYRATLEKRVDVEVKGGIDEKEAEEIKSLDLNGVSLQRQRWRYYPGGPLEARIIGFVGYEGKEVGEQPVGRYGLERYYENTLHRKDEELSVNFFAELFTNLSNKVLKDDEGKEGSVVTSIEPTVARLLQNELLKANDEWNSNLTGGIVMNPKTGAIYAIDAVPGFDPNDRGTSTLEHFSNPLVGARYEMGSIIKAITMAAGLDSGAVSPGTTYYDKGYIELDTMKINNYDRRGRGTVDMQTVLSQSLNTGATFVMSAMGQNNFLKYLEKLKLDTETGIDLVGEIHGDLSNLNTTRSIEYATASYGHGIALTPVATARALAALGNGGVLVQPHIATAIEYEDGTSKNIIYPEGDRVWSEKTSEDITRMLVRVVDEALQGGAVTLDEHSIAAKTGTAILVNDEGGYYEDRYLHSFFGYFPAYDPQFLVLLYTVDPKGVTYASETLTKPFMNITKFLINYYNIPPDR